MSGNRRIPAAPARPPGKGAPAGHLPVAVVLGMAAVYLIADASAAEWFAEGSASATGKFDDNIRLRSSNEQAVFGAIFAPQLSVQGRSEIWDMKFIADVSIAQYTEDSNLNTVDPRLRFDSSYRTMRSEFGLEAEASRQSSLVTEVTDFGNFESTTDRNLFRISPSWAYSLTELDTINFGAGWTEAFYDSDVRDDYRSFFASAGWARQVTPADQVTFSLVGNHFVSEQEIDLHSNAVSALVGWDHAMSERLNVSVAAGPQYFTTEVAVPSGGGLATEDEGSFGFQVNASVDYQLTQQTSVGASFAHQIEPSGSGSPLQRNRFEVNARHQFEPRWSASMRAFFQQDSNPTNERGDDRDRNYVAVEPRVTYALTQTWDLSGSYQFRTQETDGGDRAFSNAVMVTVSYHPMRWILGH